MKKLTLDEYKTSLSLKEPPESLSVQGRALWYAGKGDWNKAHLLVQHLHDKFSSRIHAFLHRQEGDLSNASYWYSRAGARLPDNTIGEEWEALALDYLSKA